MAHKHAEAMKQYAEDAATQDRPWVSWEYSNIAGGWLSLRGHPSWDTTAKYRRKAKTISTTLYVKKHPKPYTGVMLEDQVYYFLAPGSTDGVLKSYWSDSAIDFHRMALGFIHLTQEAATVHAEAMDLALVSLNETVSDV